MDEPWKLYVQWEKPLYDAIIYNFQNKQIHRNRSGLLVVRGLGERKIESDF